MQTVWLHWKQQFIFSPMPVAGHMVYKGKVMITCHNIERFLSTETPKKSDALSTSLKRFFLIHTHTHTQSRTIFYISNKIYNQTNILHWLQLFQKGSFTKNEAGASGQLQRNAGESCMCRNFSCRNVARALLKRWPWKLFDLQQNYFWEKKLLKKKPKQELTGEAYSHIGQKEFER